jgi:hypothetical protein
MDHHLIFPPGWKPRKGPPDSEGGYALLPPSSSLLTSALFSPNMPIPGTGITLNTPEAIDAWIAERKKKWPSAARVEEKMKNRAEAIERGELAPDTSRKRKRSDGDMHPQRQNSRGRGATYHVARGPFPRGYGRARGQGRGRGIITEPVSIPGLILTPESRSADPSTQPSVGHDSNSTSDEERSNSDMDPIKDAISSKPPIPEEVQLSSRHDFGTTTVTELDVSGVFKRLY